MSISVTVNGNPVSIQKGRMVTASPNRSKKDFEKRRLIRLSQVRQQAKSIAEDVRNRVRQEKLKQSEELVKEGQQQLKKWQSRKLLKLQNQYYDALGDMGAGHKQAVLLDDEDEELNKKKEINDKIAKQRGLSASKELMKEKVKRSLSVPLNRRKSPQKFDGKKHINCGRRSAESVREKSKEKFPTVTDVTGVVTECDIESGNVVEISENTSFKGALDDKSNLEDNMLLEIINENSVMQHVPGTERHSRKGIGEAKNTRISDRIKRRSNLQLNRPDVCETLASTSEINPQEHDSNKFSITQQNVYACTCRAPTTSTIKCPCVSSSTKLQEPDSYNHRNSKLTQRSQKSTSKSYNITAPPSSPTKPSFPCRGRSRDIAADIPTKPKVTLKSVKNSSLAIANKESGLPRYPATHVERISDENLITSPEHETEIDLHEKIKQKDTEALMRGQKALEREKLQREYDELMKKLPALKKLERMYKMHQDKPEYHMTEERLRQQEKKKQDILDNTYERLFPDRRPPTITIPVKNIPKDDKKKLTPSNSSSLNLILCESEKKSKKLYTEDEVDILLREGKVPSESKFRTDQLKSVLEKLRKRKEELLKEIPNFHEDTEQLSKALPLSHSKAPISKKDSCTNTTIDLSVKSKSDKHLKNTNSTRKHKKNVPSTENVQSGSSYETIDEPVQNLTKYSKKVPKTVQVTQSKHASKCGAEVRSTSNVKKVATKRKQEKESSSEQSSLDIPKKSSRTSPTHRPTKKQKQVEIPSDEYVPPSAPTNSLVSFVESNKMMPIVSCHCKKESDKNVTEVCEIVIKIKDQKSSRISINERKGTGNQAVCAILQTSSTIDKLNEKKKEQRRELKKAMDSDCCTEKEERVKLNSWHEKFSKNTSQISNTSTSYMSPPILPNTPEEHFKPPPYFCELIGKKPQQHNLNDISLSPPTKLPANKCNIFNDIKKLLNMSHMTIDELGISSVSTVTTPSQSIIDMESNKGTATITQTNSATSIRKPSQDTKPDGLLDFTQISVSSDNRFESSEVDNSSQNYPNVLAKYAKIAEKCSERISNLSAMIEKVREEKNRMLQNPSLLSDDISTRYMDLPSLTKRKNEKDSRTDYKLSSSSGSEGKSVLDIDYSLVEKLKGLSPEEIKNYGNLSDRFDDSSTNGADEYLEKRLKALRAPSVLPTNTESDELPYKQIEKEASIEYSQFLVDIPRLPPLTTNLPNSKQKKPPPCKSFLAARKLTEDFPKPHELSTIPEQDSQTRFESTMKQNSLQLTKERKQRDKNISGTSTPDNKKKSFETSSEGKELEKVIMEADNKLSNAHINETTLTNQPKEHKTSSKSVGILNQSDNSLGSSSVSGDEKIEMFRVEAMLRSIGMDWAISTLRKTQEALALTSSSSSLEMKNSTSKELEDVEIKNFLSRKMLQKISSSTLRSDFSLASLNGSHDLSEIRNTDGIKQTSTPINRSRELYKPQDKSSDLPSVIASEKSSRDFVSLPETSP